MTEEKKIRVYVHTPFMLTNNLGVQEYFGRGAQHVSEAVKNHWYAKNFIESENENDGNAQNPREQNPTEPPTEPPTEQKNYAQLLSGNQSDVLQLINQLPKEELAGVLAAEESDKKRIAVIKAIQQLITT